MVERNENDEKMFQSDAITQSAPKAKHSFLKFWSYNYKFLASEAKFFENSLQLCY